MKERIFSRKFWQKVFNYQLIIWFLLMISYTFSQRNNHFYFIGDLFNLAFSTAIMGLNFYVQFKKDSSKTNTQIVRWLHSLTYQGVIAAIALLTMTCFLVKAWGYHFNPNLKFIKSPSFQKKILLALLIVIFLAGFNRFPKYRIPVAIYGSAILFGLSHLSNLGWHGESFTATIAQVIGVMGSAFIWAELYLYTGKLWLPMIYHFLMDYISDLQSGWNSAGWSWNGEITDYIYTVLIVGVPLLFSIWMLFGKRRQVMEDNADLILNLNGRQSMI
ncbi:CPBP family intramembrane glutamic endopeptidase [Lactobacillus crispatus]|uniref:CPBP family intramembrane glutamic endopeptidase n=1 Tax=Lactobacillus crispatus TaxID=47770 RepID=UPI0030F90E78